MRKGPRQGDVLLVPVDKVRGERIAPTDNRFVLAEGELTGHDHSILAGPNVAVFLSRDGQFVDGETTLTHQEHTAHPISGEYEVVQQRRASLSDHRVLRPAD